MSGIMLQNKTENNVYHKYDNKTKATLCKLTRISKDKESTTYTRGFKLQLIKSRVMYTIAF